MASDVKATYLTATGSIFGGRARVKAIHYHTTGTAGSIVLKNGGATGSTELTLAFHQNSDDTLYIPDEGMLFTDGVYAVLTDVDNVTVFYN